MAPTIPAPITAVTFTLVAYNGRSFDVPSNPAMGDILEFVMLTVSLNPDEDVYFRTQADSPSWQTVAGFQSQLATGVTPNGSQANPVIALKRGNAGRVTTGPNFAAIFSAAPLDVKCVAYLKPSGGEPPPTIVT